MVSQHTPLSKVHLLILLQGPLILTVCGLALLLCGVAVTLGLVHVLGYFTSHNTHLKFAEQKRVLDEEKRQAVEQMNEAHKVGVGRISERLKLNIG